MALRESEDVSGRGRQRNKRGEGGKLREMILEAARSILEETGTESAITIRAVTRRAGIAPQSFYLQFGSLSELLLAQYEAGFVELHAALVSAVEGAQDPSERLSFLARAYIAYAIEHPGAYRSLMGTIGQPHTEWRQDDLPGMKTFALLRDAIPARHGDGSTDATDLHTTATLLWTHLHGTAILLIDRPTFPWPELDELIERIVQ